MDKNKVDSILFGIGVSSYKRFERFIDLMPILKSDLYWYALRTSYESSDNLYDFSDIIKICFLKKEKNRNSLMNNDELNYLENLPQEITIYRGMTLYELNSGNFGVSWSLKEKVARFFAMTYSRNLATNHLKRCIHKITVPKKDVIAFFNGREEFEIIYIKKRNV